MGLSLRDVMPFLKRVAKPDPCAFPFEDGRRCVLPEGHRGAHAAAGEVVEVATAAPGEKRDVG